jgi:ABC-2 type transport system permease protein
MGKYLHIVNVGIQNTLAYRVNFLVRSCFAIFPLLATIYLWRSIFEARNSETVAGYTLAGMISYYLVVNFVDMLTAVTEDDFQIAGDIKDGNISQFLLKPIDYLTYRFSLFLSGRIIYTSVAIIPLVLFVLLFRKYLVFPKEPQTWAFFLLTLLLTALLQFLISYTMALLAFWVLEVSTFIFIVYAFETLAGGQIFPLDILPPAVAQVLKFTPFPYQMFFPVSVYLEQSTGAELWQGLAMQVFWILFFYVAARLVWRKGIRHYTAVGG